LIFNSGAAHDTGTSSGDVTIATPDATPGSGSVSITTGTINNPSSHPGNIALSAGHNHGTDGSAGSIFLSAGALLSAPGSGMQGEIGLAVQAIPNIEGYIELGDNAHLNFTNGTLNM